MAISLVENRSCTRIQFHGAARNLLCRTQRTTGELRFATRESWSNFAEKISEELIMRLSALKHAFPVSGYPDCNRCDLFLECYVDQINCSQRLDVLHHFKHFL